MIIIWGIRFKKELALLPQNIKTRAKKQLMMFAQNPKYPSLKIKKMQGKNNVYEGRITHDYRFTFTKKDDKYTLRRIGLHDILRNP